MNSLLRIILVVLCVHATAACAADSDRSWLWFRGKLKTTWQDQHSWKFEQGFADISLKNGKIFIQFFVVDADDTDPTAPKKAPKQSKETGKDVVPQFAEATRVGTCGGTLKGATLRCDYSQEYGEGEVVYKMHGSYGGDHSNGHVWEHITLIDGYDTAIYMRRHVVEPPIKGTLLDEAAQ
jgi:hypothetical protein